MTSPLPAEVGAVTRDVPVRGATIRVHEAGSGPTLLCIHGGAPGATGWANFGQNVAGWARDFRVLVVDLPGFGESDVVPTPAGKFRAHADVFVGLLDEMDIDGPVHVLGLATGGAVAMRMALDHPGRVVRLVLVSSAGGLSLHDTSPTEGERAIRGYYAGDGPSREKMRDYLALTVSDPSLVTDELVEERYANSVTDRALHGSRNRGKPHPSDAVWQEADAIKARTLIVWGRDNRVKGYDNGVFLLNRIPDSELHVYSGAGLWVPFERASRIERLVTDFLLHD